MKDSSRSRVAAVVAAAIKGSKVSAIFDYSKSSYQNASVSVSNGRVNGFDYSSSTHFSGGTPGNLDFFDYDTSAHVKLKLEGDRFSGYDYHSGRHFSGSVRGRSISIFDYETSQYYNYAA